MEIRDKVKDVNIFFLLTRGVGSAMAILVADRLGLAYSASAGIITLLTIQNTKKETIMIALRRIMAFIVAVAIAYLIFSTLGYTSIAFGIFVFIFVAVCNIFGLEDGIAMNSVLTTHFLIEKNMAFSFIMNEVSILLIGMSIGIGLNLLTPQYKNKLKEEQRMIEDHIKRVLKEMAGLLRGKQGQVEIDSLKLDLDQLLDKAYEEAGNRFLVDTKYLIAYLDMRSVQVSVLQNIKDNIGQLSNRPPQAEKVADYFELVSESFHEENDVIELILALDQLYEYFRNERLPSKRQEFENRAILFLILKEIQYFLEIKRDFTSELLKG